MPAAGHLERHLPFRRFWILPGRAFMSGYQTFSEQERILLHKILCLSKIRTYVRFSVLHSILNQIACQAFPEISLFRFYALMHAPIFFKMYVIICRKFYLNKDTIPEHV